jgi:molybdopterin converting factor small subunit
LKNWKNGLAEDSITCNIMFFGEAAQAMDCREKEIAVPIGTTAGGVIDLLSTDCAQLKTIVSVCAIAIDGQLAKRDSDLQEGCTIALLPPVSGG